MDEMTIDVKEGRVIFVDNVGGPDFVVESLGGGGGKKR